ncbi:DUF4375 domain-containing protein [bacterium SCSIO 12696]|nr:DUF4375 domain-containing protein [bacterium SCSIO 12696]
MNNNGLEKRIFDQYGGVQSISSVPEPAKTVVAIYAAQGVIDYGGLGYFFESDFPSDDAYSVICQSYRNIGMPERAEALEKILSLFPDSKPHKNHARRQKFIEKYFDYGSLHPTVRWAEEVLDGSNGDACNEALEYYKKHT